MAPLPCNVATNAPIGVKDGAHLVPQTRLMLDAQPDTTALCGITPKASPVVEHFVD